MKDKTPEELEQEYYAEQDALMHAQQAEEEAKDKAEYEYQQDMDEQAEYEANQGPEEYGPEGDY